MPDDQLILAYLVTDRRVTAFAISKEKFTLWPIESPGSIGKGLADLLKLWGITEKKIGVDADILAGGKWQDTAATLLKDLTNSNKPEMWDAYREVVIVPDGLLWYVPFDALQIARGQEFEPLLGKVRLRYVPTAGLANASGLVRKPHMRTAAVVGKLHLQQDDQVGADAWAGIRQVLPDAQRLGDVLPGPSSLLAAACDRAVVLCDLEQKTRGPYDWAPLHVDRNKAGGSLDSWLTLPWQGPAELILPGFHTQAETGLKRGANGSEVFLPVCGLMAAGARSILLTRWSAAGQSTYDLVREYLQELPYASAAEAWHRSVELARGNPLDPAREPRLNRSGVKGDPTADHPFFWAGFLLIDSGTRPAPEAKP